MVIAKRDGTPEERSQYFREMQAKSRETYKGTGGLGSPKLDPKKKRLIQSMGGKAPRNLNKGAND